MYWLWHFAQKRQHRIQYFILAFFSYSLHFHVQLLLDVFSRYLIILCILHFPFHDCIFIVPTHLLHFHIHPFLTHYIFTSIHFLFTAFSLFLLTIFLFFLFLHWIFAFISWPLFLSHFHNTNYIFKIIKHYWILIISWLHFFNQLWIYDHFYLLITFIYSSFWVLLFTSHKQSSLWILM